MSKARINSPGYRRLEPFEHLGRLVNALDRDVRIDVAAAQKDRRAFERAFVVKDFISGRRLSLMLSGTNEPPAQPDHATQAARITCDVLERKTGTLGETQNYRAFRQHICLRCLPNYGADFPEAG